MKKIYDIDSWLQPFIGTIDARHQRILDARKAIVGSSRGSLSKAINNYLYYGLHKEKDGSWVFREWAPNASRLYLIGDFNNWKRTPAYELKPVGQGNWELRVPESFMSHGSLYKLFIEWTGGGGERLPAYCTRAVQDPRTKIFSAQVWCPPKPYSWKNDRVLRRPHPLIYECHIGMSSEERKVATFDEFRMNILPRVKKLGYDTLQIMALQEHPYYGSFGYQVSNFYALSSRFGTPEEFKHLVDEAHGMGIAVVMDLVHSHSVDNEQEGLSLFDGRDDLYFYHGPQGRHPAWGSRCFDYGKPETMRFLLANCKFWLEEYHLDGFRFDGVTSMLYWDHGLGKAFGDYNLYFNQGVDENAVTYLALANMLIKEVKPSAITIAEDVSGMPGLAAPFNEYGMGFDFRMAMGIADHWIKWIKEKRDEDWSMGEMWYELTVKRPEEKTISYAECHDQALVGDKTIIFRLMDKDMYFYMNKDSKDIIVDRGIALHKLIRLVTLCTAGNGYLNFMGNEFGHPEWIDFPREGNGWSYEHARRQWSLSEPDYLRYKYLQNFDIAMIHLAKRFNIFSEKPVLLRSDEEKKVLVLQRKNIIFAFNFHPTESFPDYGFQAPEGEWDVILDSDAAEFDGFSRQSGDGRHFVVGGELRLYLPTRCALVLIRK
jgi:1,4-alpha-glucan branching enzyme